MTDIDTATGLPALPDGYFWGVAEGGTFLFIKLVKRGWINRTLKKSPIYKRDATPSLIRHVAQDIYRETFDNNWQRYVGDYPPKSLNSNV